MKREMNEYEVREQEALAGVEGKTIEKVIDGLSHGSREELTIMFTDGTHLKVVSCNCCGGMGVESE